MQATAVFAGGEMAVTRSMRLVFRLEKIGFYISIAEVVEIRENSGSWLQPSCGAGGDSPVLGEIPFRGETVEVFDPRAPFGLAPREHGERLTALVVYGPQGYLAVEVDGVEGIFAEKEFALRELPPLLCPRDQSIYREVAIWRGEPLVHFDLQALAHVWGAE